MTPDQKDREREAFDTWFTAEKRKTFPADYDESRFANWGEGLRHDREAGWMARAALSVDQEGHQTDAASVRIDFKQATELLAMFGGEAGDITLSVGECDHAGPGLYAYFTDYPEEGSIHFGVTDEEATPDADSEKPAGEPWKELFWQVALALKCLPSSYIDGNEHVLRVAKERTALASAPAPSETAAVAQALQSGEAGEVVLVQVKTKVNDGAWLYAAEPAEPAAPVLTESQARTLNAAIRRYATQETKTAARKLIEDLSAAPAPATDKGRQEAFRNGYEEGWGDRANGSRHAFLSAAAAPVEPAAPVQAWEYQNRHGTKFLTHSDPNKWHPHDQDGLKEFRALVYAPATKPEPASAPSEGAKLLEDFERAVSTCSSLRAQYMGKAMPDRDYDIFAANRDNHIPRLRKQLLATLAPTAPALQKGVTKPSIDLGRYAGTYGGYRKEGGDR